MDRVVCIGLDLAWSSRNLSGGAVMLDGVLCNVRADLGSDEAIGEWIGSWLLKEVATVVAVDAPLCVPNLDGKRACERQLAAEWAFAHAGPYPSNRSRFNNDIRGERIVKLLGESFGFVERVEIAPSKETRLICEVYPHPAHVSLFARKSILKYKKKGKRTYDECWTGLEEYQTLLQGLVRSDPPLLDPKGNLDIPIAGVKGKALKAIEDTLDAVTCAYIAAYLWRHGAAGTRVYGSVTDGHILVPRVPPLAHYSMTELT